MHMLERMRHRVEVAATGTEAVSASVLADCDCILMDCRVPQMDGLEAKRPIRAREIDTGLGCTPIIALTANAMDGDRAACLDGGTNACLAKPATIEALAVSLDEC